MIEEFFFQTGIITWKRSGRAESGVQSRAILFRAGVRRAVRFAVYVALSSSADRNDIVGYEPGFSRDHQSHRDAFCFVVVAAMHQVSDANRRAKSQG
jgi:hypothetical protein